MQENKTLDGISSCDAAARQLCRELAGRSILLLGAGKAVFRGLQLVSMHQGASFEILTQEEADQDRMHRLQTKVSQDRELLPQTEAVQQKDFVILTGSVAGMRENENQIDTEPWKEFLKLSELLEQLRKRNPAAVLLLSDMSVYGKVFGTAHALKEDEMGYVCHTDPKDAHAQCMRNMEHLCSRLGREEGFPVKIARVDGDVLRKLGNSLAGNSSDGKSGAGDTESEIRGAGTGEQAEILCEQLAVDLLKVLLRGKPGESYNLTFQGSEKYTGTVGEQERSPLSPMPIVLDAGKAGRL